MQDLSVLDINGDTVKLNSVWSEHTAIVVFLRHFL